MRDDDIDTTVTMTGQHYTAAVCWDQVAIDGTWVTALADKHLPQHELDVLPAMSATMGNLRTGMMITLGFGTSMSTITHTYIDGKRRSPFRAVDLLEEPTSA